MSDAQVDDLLWRALEPLLPPRKRSPKGGHPFADDRARLAGILFVPRTDRPWRDVPAGLGVRGVTCWRRLRDWQAAGVWARLHEAALGKLGRSGGLDWSRASLDSTSVRAEKGGEQVGPSPTDRGRGSTRLHLIVDRLGTPLACLVSPRQPQRPALPGSAPRRGAARARRARPSSPSPLQAPRRQGLRPRVLPRGLPGGLPGEGRPGPHRPSRRGVVREPRASPLGRRADLRLAALHAPPRGRLGAQGRSLARLRAPRLRRPVPARARQTPGLVKRPLRGSRSSISRSRDRASAFRRPCSSSGGSSTARSTICRTGERRGSPDVRRR